MAAEPTTVASLSDLRARAATPETQLPQVRLGFDNLQSFELMQRVAKAFASSSLVPANYQGNLPDCIIAIELAQRIGASPLMVAQNLYIVHGKPAWSSQFLIAAVNQCGRYTALKYDWTGTQGRDDWTCRAWATDRATGERVQGPAVSISMAKKEGWYDKKGSKWQTIPELMLMYRAATFFARTNAPELTMGLSAAEEVHDVYDAALTPTGEFTVAGLKDGERVIDQPASAPDDDSDRAKVIAQIEACADQEVAAIALDGARGKPWYAEAEAAYLAKFGS